MTKVTKVTKDGELTTEQPSCKITCKPPTSLASTCEGTCGGIAFRALEGIPFTER